MAGGQAPSALMALDAAAAAAATAPPRPDNLSNLLGVLAAVYGIYPELFIDDNIRYDVAGDLITSVAQASILEHSPSTFLACMQVWGLCCKGGVPCVHVYVLIADKLNEVLSPEPAHSPSCLQLLTSLAAGPTGASLVYREVRRYSCGTAAVVPVLLRCCPVGLGLIFPFKLGCAACAWCESCLSPTPWLHPHPMPPIQSTCALVLQLRGDDSGTSIVSWRRMFSLLAAVVQKYYVPPEGEAAAGGVSAVALRQRASELVMPDCDSQALCAFIGLFRCAGRSGVRGGGRCAGWCFRGAVSSRGAVRRPADLVLAAAAAICSVSGAQRCAALRPAALLTDAAA